MSVPDLDKLLGMDVYATKTQGVSGRIKASVEDFVVEEVLVDGSKANLNGAVPSRVLGSTVQKQRFLLCVLVKRNWDTFIAVKNIARSLGIDQARVQFAGIKDAKAVTAQHITIENVSIEDAANVDVKEIEVHPVGYVREMLSLFYLLGNNFTITIKSITGSEETVKAKHQPNHAGTRRNRRYPELFWSPTLRNHPSHNPFGWKSPCSR